MSKTTSRSSGTKSSPGTKQLSLFSMLGNMETEKVETKETKNEIENDVLFGNLHLLSPVTSKKRNYQIKNTGSKYKNEKCIVSKIQCEEKNMEKMDFQEIKNTFDSSKPMNSSSELQSVDKNEVVETMKDFRETKLAEQDPLDIPSVVKPTAVKKPRAKPVKKTPMEEPVIEKVENNEDIPLAPVAAAKKRPVSKKPQFKSLPSMAIENDEDEEKEPKSSSAKKTKKRKNSDDEEDEDDDDDVERDENGFEVRSDDGSDDGSDLEGFVVDDNEEYDEECYSDYDSSNIEYTTDDNTTDCTSSVDEDEDEEDLDGNGETPLANEEDKKVTFHENQNDKNDKKKRKREELIAEIDTNLIIEGSRRTRKPTQMYVHPDFEKLILKDVKNKNGELDDDLFVSSSDDQDSDSEQEQSWNEDAEDDESDDHHQKKRKRTESKVATKPKKIIIVSDDEE